MNADVVVAATFVSGVDVDVEVAVADVVLDDWAAGECMTAEDKQSCALEEADGWVEVEESGMEVEEADIEDEQSVMAGDVGRGVLGRCVCVSCGASA